MPDIFVDVDTAVILPVNILPLLDDTDFKSIETAVVYNSAGLALTWNFVTAAGVQTGNAITPTDGTGVFDWSEPLADKGMYAIEMPASGAAAGSNNDREGVGWFTGVATGVLPWRGPTIGFRRAALNDLFMDGGTASTNLEDFFDGTGYAGGTAKLTVNTVQVNGTAQTAGDIVAAVITNAAGVDIAADIIAVKADTAAILTDTGTTLEADLDAIIAAVITNAAGVDIAADIIAVKAETATILADTNELQTDDYPTSIAAVKADTAAILIDTAVIGAAGAGLTDLGGMSTTMKAQVETEANDALVANNLDHIALTAVAIPAIPAGTYIDQMMDDGTAVYDRTTDSLQALRDNLATAAALDAVDNFVDTEVGTIITTLGTPVTSIAADIAAIEAQTDDIGIAGAGLTALRLSATGVDDILDEAVEGTYTLRQILKVVGAAFSKVTGGGTATITFRDMNDTANRITMTVDADGNRSAVTFNV